MSTPHEEEALGVLREACKDVRGHGLPCDAAFPARLTDAVRAAYRDGGYQTALAIREAFELFMEHEAGNLGLLNKDMDFLAKAINEACPPGTPPV